MSKENEMDSPKSLDDISHLFFSKVEDPNPRSEEGILPPLKEEFDPTAVKKLLSSNGDALFEGARLVDGESREPEGFDLILTDGRGNPAFLDILREDATTIPFRILSCLDWLKKNSGLFVKAYQCDGILKVDDPLFLFVAPSFPDEVVHAVAKLDFARARLLRVSTIQVEGIPGMLIEEVYPERRGQVLKKGSSLEL